MAFLLAASVAVGASTTLVSAQSCNASLGSSSLSSDQYYYNSYIGINTPVSVSCSYYSSQLYAVGDAFDTSANVDLGSVNTILTLSYGGNTYAGQLAFNLPPSVFGHQVRLSVSVYGGQNGYYGNGKGQLLAQAAQMVKVTTSYQNGYPNGNGNCNSAYNCNGNDQNYYCDPNAMYCYPANGNGNCYSAYNCNNNCYQNYNCYPNGTYCNTSNCYTYYPTCYYTDGYHYYQVDCDYQHHHHH